MALKLLLLYASVAGWYVLRAAAIGVLLAAVVKGLVTEVPLLVRQMDSDGGTTVRGLYAAVSHFCLLILGIVFGVRLHNFFTEGFKEIRVSFINGLVVLLYFLCASFVIISSILLQTLDMRDRNSCKAAIYCCLVFYLIGKGVLQLFLVERAHMIRAHQRSRLRDPIWVGFILMLTLGFGCLAVIAFMWPVAEVRDGVCRIGVHPYVAMPLLLYDVLINLCLTGTFIYLLHSLVKPHKMQAPSASSGISIEYHVTVKSEPDQELNRLQPDISSTVTTVPKEGIARFSKARSAINPKHNKWTERLIARSATGLVLMLIPTIANLALMYHVHGLERGWECLAFCCIDVTWTVCVVAWLTHSPREREDPRARAIPRSHQGTA